MKILPSSPNNEPKNNISVSDILKHSETIGKLGTTILGVFYVAGIIVFGAYYSNLHIRSIELFRVRYFFVGFYFCLFLYLFFVFPQFNIKRAWAKILYYIVFVIFFVLIDNAVSVYVNHLLSVWITGETYFKFTPSQISIIWGRGVITISLSISTLLSYGYSISFFNQASKQIFQEKISSNKAQAYIFLVASFILGLSLFINSIFPNIPDALGGGKAPLVSLEFKKTTPYSTTINFDISASSKLEIYPHWARLVYVDSDSLFLQSAFWFSDEVYEVPRDDVELIRYETYNPVEIGSPYLTIP